MTLMKKLCVDSEVSEQQKKTHPLVSLATSLWKGTQVVTFSMGSWAPQR